MKLKYIPNIITLIRILLIVPFLVAFFREQYHVAFYIFLIAGFSDGVDGYLARYFNWQSHFGAFIDPLADKLLMMISFICLAWLGVIPLILFWIVILRDIIIMSGVGGILYIRGEIDVQPSLVSKLNTVLQIALIAFLLFELAYHTLADQFIFGLMIAVTITTIASLVGYLFVGIKHAFFFKE